MRIARAHFKYALRFVKNQEEIARADSLTKDFSDKDVDGFWKMTNCNTKHANVIDGVTRPENIASHWKQHFNNVLNIYVNCDNSLKTDMLSNFDNIEYDSYKAVSTKSVSGIISKLECGIYAGPDGIEAEYIKFSSINTHVLLSMSFTLCLTHGYIAPAMIETTIVPLVKINQVIYRTVIIIGQSRLPPNHATIVINYANEFYHVHIKQYKPKDIMCKTM